MQMIQHGDVLHIVLIIHNHVLIQIIQHVYVKLYVIGILFIILIIVLVIV